MSEQCHACNEGTVGIGQDNFTDTGTGSLKPIGKICYQKAFPEELLPQYRDSNIKEIEFNC